jgi:hypothetical protein
MWQVKHGVTHLSIAGVSPTASCPVQQANEHIRGVAQPGTTPHLVLLTYTTDLMRHAL